MNKKFIQILGLIILIVLALSNLFIQSNLSQNLYRLMSSELSSKFENSATLMSGSIRNDLLVNDIRSARVKMGIYIKQNIILGYRIYQDNHAIDEVVMNHPSAGAVTISQEIPFSGGGAVWGKVEYIFSNKTLAENFNSLENTLRIHLFLIAGSILIAVLAAFVILYLSSSNIQPILNNFIGSSRQIKSGKFVGFVWKPLIETLTESIMKYQILRDENEKFRRSAAIGQIVGQLSHDLRAPLATFEHLIHLPADKLIAEQTEKIRASLNRINSLIDSLRFTDAELLVNALPVRFSLKPMMIGLDAVSTSKDVRIDAYPDLNSDILVKMDIAKFERAIVNLISNALDFAKTRVSVEWHVVSHDLIVLVKDDGLGVTDEFLPKLFQRGATHGKHDGSGLGLAYVRQIMRGHGGDVTYRRENGLTIFECRLPNAVVENQEDDMARTLVATTREMIQVKQVGICFVPRSMSEALCAELASLKSERFSFSTEYDGSDFIATNDPDLALTATEEGKQPLEFKATLAEAVLLDGLKRRFDLV